MALRLVLVLAVLAVPLSACDPNRDPARKAAVEEMDRRHSEAAKYKGGM